MAKKKSGSQDKRTSIIMESELNTLRYGALYKAIFVMILVFCLITMLPVLWVLISSTKDIDEFYRIPPTIIPQSFHPEKIGQVWKMIDFGKAYLNTIVMAIGTVFFSIAGNGLMAYSLSRIKPKGSDLILKLLFLTMLLPSGGTLAAKMKLIVDFPIFHINFINTPWPMWIMGMASCFTIIWFKDYFDSVSQSVIEAARLDGLGEVGIFTKIMIPLCKPVIFYQVIMNINHAWADYFWPMLVFKNKSLQTVMVRALALQGKLAMDEQLIMLTFVMLPPMIFFIIFQKKFMYGMDGGAVKG